MSLLMISPQQAQELAARGAVLVDVREPREFVSEHIEGAINLPLSSISGKSVGKAGETVIFLCKSGVRTNMAVRQLEQATKAKAVIMDGGLMAWKLQGFPTTGEIYQKPSSRGLLAALLSRFGTGR